jgi:hypothetical protein
LPQVLLNKTDETHIIADDIFSSRSNIKNSPVCLGTRSDANYRCQLEGIYDHQLYPFVVPSREPQQHDYAPARRKSTYAYAARLRDRTSQISVTHTPATDADYLKQVSYHRRTRYGFCKRRWAKSTCYDQQIPKRSNGVKRHLKMPKQPRMQARTSSCLAGHALVLLQEIPLA